MGTFKKPETLFVMTEHNEDTKTPEVLGFEINRNKGLKEEDLNRLKSADSVINVLLGEMQYISKIVGHNKNVAPVENLKEKVEASSRRIQEHLNKEEQNLEQNQQPTNDNKSGPPLEKHPLLPELGGMNLEWDKLDQEWLKELGVDQTQDKSEVENQIKNKLQNRIKNALKLATKLQNKLRNQPAFKPAQKQVNDYVIKYKMTLDDLKNKPMLKPEAPEYQPRYTPSIPPPRPGMP